MNWNKLWLLLIADFFFKSVKNPKITGKAIALEKIHVYIWHLLTSSNHTDGERFLIAWKVRQFSKQVLISFEYCTYRPINTEMKYQIA